MKELSYKKNTFYLICAGALSQIFGAAQKIVLTHFLKEEGMAIYQSALCVYSVFLTLSCGGIPTAVTHFISKEHAGGDEKSVFYVLKFSLSLVFVLSLALSIIMFCLRGFFGTAIKEPLSEYAIATLSPSVFIVSLGALIKSCFEGYANMRPYAVSYAAESFIKLILAYSLTSFLCIFSIKYAAFGGTLAITLGEAAATVILFAFFRPFLNKMRNLPSCPEIRKAILTYALPITAYAIILSTLNLFENAVIRNSLLAIRFTGNTADRFLNEYSQYTSVFDTLKSSDRLTLSSASWLYGAFFGYALTIIRFPAGLLSTFSVSFFPLAARKFAEQNIPAVASSLSRITKVMLCISVPFCVFFIIFKREITALVFSSSACSVMLAYASPLLILSPLCSIFSAVEYASGMTFIPFLFNLLAFTVSIPLCFILIRLPLININGVAIASVIGAATELVLHLVFLFRHLNIRLTLSS